MGARGSRRRIASALASRHTAVVKIEDGKAVTQRRYMDGEKMVLENFKSYAGAQHVGPFHKVRRDAFDARRESMSVIRRDDERGERLTATRARGDDDDSLFRRL